jgi:hypothetical protein
MAIAFGKEHAVQDIEVGDEVRKYSCDKSKQRISRSTSKTQCIMYTYTQHAYLSTSVHLHKHFDTFFFLQNGLC